MVGVSKLVEEIIGPVCYAVDMSQWGGEYTIAEAIAVRAAGFDLCMPASGPGGYGKMFLQQASSAVAAGQLLGTYSFLEWGENPRQWAAQAYSSVGKYADQIGWWAVDLEDNTNTPPPSLNARIAYAEDFIDQLQEFGVPKSNILIYTGGWYWTRPDAFQNTDHFARQGYGLYESYYDENANRNSWAGCPWAWEQIIITQYGNTQYVGGQSVDTNAVYRLPNGDHSNTLEEDMSTIEEVNKLKMGVFAGGERIRAGWSDQQRLEFANEVLRQCNDTSDGGSGAAQSLFDMAASAITIASNVSKAIGSENAENNDSSNGQLLAVLAAATAKAESFSKNP